MIRKVIEFILLPIAIIIILVLCGIAFVLVSIQMLILGDDMGDWDHKELDQGRPPR
jgi:hypothetical protein